MKIKDAWIWIVFVLLLWSGFNVAKPFWDRYWLGKELQTVAIYGTKHSVQSTRRLLTAKMKEEGREVQGEDFVIEKTPEKDVTITLTYTDRINIFGKTLKELEFTVEGRARYVPTML